MVFLMSRNVSKHILLALVSLYSHRCQKGKICQGFYQVSQSSPIAVSREASARLWSVHVPHYIGLASPSLARHPANAVELATKVCFLLFDESEVSATDVIYVGKIMQRVVPQKLAAHLPYRYTYRKSGNSCVHLIRAYSTRCLCLHELNHTGFTHYVITTYSAHAAV